MPSRPTLQDQAEPALRARLQRLKLRAGLAAATVHRRTLRQARFIGVTGSCGKTTTKELIAAALGSALRGRKSPGEGNGLAIVGKTVLRTTDADAFCVIEVAASKPGSVAEQARAIRPHIAVVTNVGTDHRSAFRTLEATAAEKRTLLDHVVEGGTVVLNADDPRVAAMAESFAGRVIRFGCAPEALLRARDVRSPWPEPLSITLDAGGRSFPVRTRLYGKHWASSVLAALAVATAMEVPLEQAAEALATVEPTPGRMSPVSRNGVTFVRDDVKAPMWALDAAFEFLADARARRRVAVIGTISDYAGASDKRYPRVARRALEVADEVVFVGPQARHALKADKNSRTGALHAFETLREADEHLRASLRHGDLVLLKGSKRTDQLHRIVPAQ